jgi:cbb3-type cytochrome oxidase subunit 3
VALKAILTVAKCRFFLVGSNTGGLSLGAKIGIGVAAGVVVLIIVALAVIALRQKRRADKAEEHQNPFGTCFATTHGFPFHKLWQMIFLPYALISGTSNHMLRIVLSLFSICSWTASWPGSDTKNVGNSAPKVEGARYFSYNELKKASNNFSESNEIGSGGYGKVCIARN